MTDTVSRRAILRTAVAAAIGTPLAAAQRTATARRAPKVELFAHRGACATWPEHTFGSYVQAIADGADYIEPDLVSTRDGVLVARHENNIVETTDVATRPQFATRRTTKTIDGKVQTGWFVEDFSLAELKTLRAIERMPKIRPANTRYDGLFQIPTWDEVIELVAAESITRKRVIGLVPEIKSSTYFASIGLAMEDRFLQSLAGHAYTRTAPVEIQSFEIANLKYMRGKLGRPANIRLMQLVGPGDLRPADVVAAAGSLTFARMTSASGLLDIRTYADVVAPPTRSTACSRTSPSRPAAGWRCAPLRGRMSSRSPTSRRCHKNFIAPSLVCGTIPSLQTLEGGRHALNPRHSRRRAGSRRRRLELRRRPGQPSSRLRPVRDAQFQSKSFRSIRSDAQANLRAERIISFLRERNHPSGRKSGLHD